jgi:ribonuclease D
MSAKNCFDYEIIDTAAGLENLAARLQKEKTVTVDLEADSMYHFKEKVCLVQIGARNINAVIDSLQIRDLGALKPIFKNGEIRKVFHGADYDVRSLFRDFQITVDNLFDTQLACRFLGLKETSLEAVIRKWYKVNLNKKFQRKDWSKRPLPEEMMAYAAEDVRYLLPLAQRLESKLKLKGRLSWVYEECEHLSKVRSVENEPGALFLHFKGAGKLDRQSLAVLEALLQFRKKIARKRDKPLFRIVSNGSLMNLAVARPMSIKHLKKTRALSPDQINMYGNEIVAAVKAAHDIAESSLPVYPRKRPPSVPAQVGKRVKALRNWKESQAKKLDMDPALILTNALISTLAAQNPLHINELSKIAEMKKWQRKTFGKDIVSLLKKAG